MSANARLSRPAALVLLALIGAPGALCFVGLGFPLRLVRTAAKDDVAWQGTGPRSVLGSEGLGRKRRSSHISMLTVDEEEAITARALSKVRTQTNITSPRAWII